MCASLPLEHANMYREKPKINQSIGELKILLLPAMMTADRPHSVRLQAYMLPVKAETGTDAFFTSGVSSPLDDQ